MKTRDKAILVALFFFAVSGQFAVANTDIASQTRKGLPMTDFIETKQSKSEYQQKVEYLVACASRVVRWTKKSPYTQDYCLAKLAEAIRMVKQ